jgi:hypothetical protein
MATTKTAYCVQQDGGYIWFDVTEWMEYLPTAESALARYREDCPSKSFRLAEYTPSREDR